MRSAAVALVPGAVVAWLAAATTALPGQDASAVFRGSIVRDSTRAAIADVEVVMEGLGTARSSAEGKFLFAAVAPGTYRVTLRHPGLKPIEGTVRLSPRDTVERDFVMVALATDLPGVEVRADGAPISIGLAEFEKRRALGVGKFLTPADFKGRANSTLTDVLRAKVGGLILERTQNGDTPVATRRGAQATLLPSAPGQKDPRCYMQVIVDGARIWRPGADQIAGPPSMDDFATADIAGVEIYRGVSETPLQFSGPSAACGTIVIWTATKR